MDGSPRPSFLLQQPAIAQADMHSNRKELRIAGLSGLIASPLTDGGGVMSSDEKDTDLRAKIDVRIAIHEPFSGADG